MKFSIITISFLVSVLFLTHITQIYGTCPEPVPSQYAHAKPGNIVAAYFASWDTYGKGSYTYKVEDMYPIAHKLTHVIYAFAIPDVKSGTCRLKDPWLDVGANYEYRKKTGGNFAKLLELKKRFPHIKVLLSVGGGAHSKQISELVQQGRWKTFIQSAVALLDSYTYEFNHSKTGEKQSRLFEYEDLFDGLDFDYEWVDNKVPEVEAKAYVKMILMLKKLLDERSKRQNRKSLLTVALQPNSSIYKVLDTAAIASHIDWFHVMTYNFTGPFSEGIGFNAPLCNPWSAYSVDNAISDIINLGVSPEKIVLGIPLYGHVFDQTSPKLGSKFSLTEITGALSYDKIKESYLLSEACQYKWHDKSSVPYLYCSDDKIFISYDDELSIKKKVEYSRQKRLKGVMLWKLAGDDDEHTLVNAI